MQESVLQQRLPAKQGRLGTRTRDLDVGVIYTHENDLMPRLLWSLSLSTGDLATRLILVDNASQQGAQVWDSCFESTRIVRNNRRLTYAENLNRVLRNSTASYVLLLNTDMYFDPQEQCVAKMVDFMDENPGCGIAGCRLYRADDSYAYPARRFQSLRTIAARRLGRAKLTRGALDAYLYKDCSPYSAFECEWLSGCFLLMRRAAFEEVGFFDTGFRKYFEDVDICLRMALAGWRVMLNGGTHCYHLEQRASKRLLSRDAWVHALSYLRWLKKWGFNPAGCHRRALSETDSSQDTRAYPC